MMGQEILSLKSIYKILTANDYPVYSDKVISKEHHKGLSLYGFWQSILIPEWKNTPTGMKIWRSAGGRNRYTSEICNRSEHNHYYGKYLKEIASVYSTETLFQQTFQFMLFLHERGFNYQAFLYRVKAAIKLYSREDMFFDKNCCNFFAEILQQEASFAAQGNFGKVFFCGYMLTMLTLHALGGNGNEKGSLDKIRNQFGCDVRTAYLDAGTKEIVSQYWKSIDRQNSDLQLVETERKTREYLEYLIACYEQLKDVEKTEILRNTLNQLFD